MKKFIYKLIIYSLLPLSIFIIFNISLKYSTWDNFRVINFQFNKLKKYKGRHFKIIYIGDSSGGYSIDTDNYNSINLCLTGSFGFLGVNEFQHIIDEYITYDTIVHITSLNVLSRPVNSDIKIITNLYSSNLHSRFTSFFESIIFFQPIVKNYLNDDLNLDYYSNNFKDYPMDLSVKKNPVLFKLKGIDQVSLLELKSFQNRVINKKRYYFFFGPNYKADLNDYNYVKSVFNYNGIYCSAYMPFVLDDSSIGNDEWHINPSINNVSTRYYLKLMK